MLPILLLAVIPIVLLVHELGHLIVARLYHVGVVELSIGIGPKCFGFVDRSGTEWNVRLLPLAAWTKYGKPPSSNLMAHRTVASTISLAEASSKQRAHIYSAGILSNLVVAGLIVSILLVFFKADVLFQESARIEFSLAYLSAVWSISIALFNLLPIPALDGWLLVSEMRSHFRN